MMTEEEYADAIERLYFDTYQDKMKALLQDHAARFRDLAFEVEGPFEMTDTTFMWEIFLSRQNLPGTIDIRLEVAESLECGDDLAGINFSLDITSKDGEMLGGLTPYNYTTDCWVPLDEPMSIEARWGIIAQADVDGIVTLIDDWAARKCSSPSAS